jgi:HSP20 family protein
MAQKKETALARKGVRDPFALLKEMTSELDRMFDASAWSPMRWPVLRAALAQEPTTWYPKIDVFEKDQRMVTRIDLPGMKKEDVKVEVTDSQLTISGERKSDTEEKRENYYRAEREYGSFYRTIPLPEGVTVEDVKATFSDGVLEVSLPLPAKPESTVRTIEIQEAPKAGKAA